MKNVHVCVYVMHADASNAISIADHDEECVGPFHSWEEVLAAESALKFLPDGYRPISLAALCECEDAK